MCGLTERIPAFVATRFTGLGLFAAVLGGFVIFWIFLKIWVAFGFLAVVAILLGFAWWYDRREKRARAGLPRV